MNESLQSPKSRSSRGSSSSSRGKMSDVSEDPEELKDSLSNSETSDNNHYTTNTKLNTSENNTTQKRIKDQDLGIYSETLDLQ